MADIQRYGAGDGLGYYFIRRQASVGGAELLYLAAIDEYGRVTYTGVYKPDDPGAFTEAEAVHDHLSAAIKQASDREPPERPEPETEPEPPMDPATARFFRDDIGNAVSPWPR